jgi:hypothetical protein
LGNTWNASVQISSPSLAGAATAKPAASSSGASASSGATALDPNASQGNSIVQEFRNYAKMNPIDRLRANIMKSMNVTQQQIDAMPPAQQQAIEQKIEQLVKEQMQKNVDGQSKGQVVDFSA